MTELSKGKSPFYPGQPVPADLFVGRKSQLQRIITRGVSQVAKGKPVAIYIEGEYGIGKSSIAGFVQSLAERNYGLHGIYVPLGGAHTLTEVAQSVLEGTLRSGAFDPRKSDKIKNWLAKYVGKQDLFGALSLNFEALKSDAPGLTTPFSILGFLTEAHKRLASDEVKGVFLVMDEINGIASDPSFAHFIKGIVDTNALSNEPLPLLLMLCGTQERRQEMIRTHQPIDRIFDVIDVQTMSDEEMAEFFQRAFQSVQIKVEPDAMKLLTSYSAGFPKIVHLVGDAAFWNDRDGVIDKLDAEMAILEAAEEVGKRYVDHQVYGEIRSGAYLSILATIADLGGPAAMSFQKKEVAAKLTPSEKKKFNNFLQKMKKLNVIRSGDIDGEYIFNLRMVRLYIWLKSREKKKPGNASAYGQSGTSSVPG